VSNQGIIPPVSSPMKMDRALLKFFFLGSMNSGVARFRKRICSLIAPDLFPVPLLLGGYGAYSHGTGTDWDLNRVKRNLAPGYLSNLFFYI